LFVPISASTSSNDQVDDVLDYDFYVTVLNRSHSRDILICKKP